MKWEIKPKAPNDFLNQFPEYPPLVLQLLYDRGLKTQEAIDEFFNPDYGTDLHNPFLMKGMEKVVKRILKAIERKEKIVIFGDYDADGVCGAVILQKTLQALGANLLDTYIPDRTKEGYGLNLKAIHELSQRGAKLILTVDCGVTDFEEIKLAKSLKIEVIVIDHHQVIKKIPQALVIDPYQKGDQYPFKRLAAAGVAFKLAQALFRSVVDAGKLKLFERKTKSQKAGRDVPQRRVNVSSGAEKWLLDLVALATVADMMPLLGENRTLVKYGLIVLAQTQRIGLKELMKVVGLSPSLVRRQMYLASGLERKQSPIANHLSLNTNLDTYTIGFILAPRLNVASRMEHANLTYQLLITESEEEAKWLAQRLDQINKERQQLVDKIVQEIELKLQTSGIKKIIFEASRDWPIGVAGLVASKLSEKYHRPAFIFNIEGEKAKGSARSTPQFNLIEAISSGGQFLEEYGGHPQAAGCNLLIKNLEKFKNYLEEIAEQKLKEEDLIPVLEIDYEIKPEEINWQTYDQIQNFAPFGQANPKPLFLLSDLEITDLRTVGNNGKHLKLNLKCQSRIKYGANTKTFKAIGFNCGARCQGLKIGDKIDIVFELLVDEWNGTRDLQLKIVDFKLANIHK